MRLDITSGHKLHLVPVRVVLCIVFVTIRTRTFCDTKVTPNIVFVTAPVRTKNSTVLSHRVGYSVTTADHV
mgnify:CR=1 FL=1